MRVFFLFFSITFHSITLAHGGGTDETGCHTDKKTSSRHCHNSETSPLTQPINSLEISTLTAGDGHSILIKNIQVRLQELGYQVDKSGIAGARTVMAIKLYQQSNQLLMTGLPGEELLAHMKPEQ